MRFSNWWLMLGLLIAAGATAQDEPDFLRPDRQGEAFQSGQEMGKSALDRALANHRKMAERRGYTDKGPEPIYLLVSTSMPEGVLKNYYLDAREHGKPVIFVVRGFEPKRIQDVIKPFVDISDGRMDVPVEVNPTLFRDLDVELVPAAVAQDGEGAWRVARGDASLGGLLEAVKTGNTDTPLGRRYEISEPDLLAVIEERIQTIDWEAKRQAAADRIVSKITQHDLQVPVAKDKRVDWVDPTVTANRDIRNPEGGEVLVRAGQQANPLEHVTLQRAYAVFDPTDPGQRRVVEAWRKDHENLGMLATRYPPEPEALTQLSEDLGGPLMQANDLLIRRLNIRTVPALVRQDGKTIKVESRPPIKEDRS